MTLKDIFKQLTKKNVLCGFSLDYAPGKRREFIIEKANLYMKLHPEIKGFILPHYNIETGEEMEEDGSALVLFQVLSSDKQNKKYTWKTCVKCFEKKRICRFGKQVRFVWDGDVGTRARCPLVH